MPKKKKIEFKNDYTLDMKLYQEFNIKYLLSNLPFILIIFITFEILIITLLKEYENLRNLTAFILLISLVFFLIYKISIRYNFKRTCLARNCPTIENSLIINSEGITIIDNQSNNKLTYHYNQIKSIIETPSILILKLKYHMGIIITIENIKGGTKEELIEFLKTMSEIPKVKRVSNKKIQYLKIFLIINFIFLLISIFLDYQKSNYYQKIISILKNNNYEVELYSNTDSELVVYGLNKATEHHTSYLYLFKDLEKAGNDFNNWLEVEHINTDFCTFEINYNICTFKEEDKYLVMVRNYKTIFYSETTPEYQGEIEELLKKINYLK